MRHLKYKILEEEATADMAFIAYGKTLEEAFENAALVVFETMTNLDKVEKKTKKTIKIKSEDEKSLLFDFIDNLLFYKDAENLLFSSVKVKKIQKTKEGFTLEAEALGEEFDPEKHEQRSLVKAITYFGMEIKKGKEGWSLKITLDL